MPDHAGKTRHENADPDRQQIIDRILKILALATGTPFEAEAASARRMADELSPGTPLRCRRKGRLRGINRGQIICPVGKKLLWERIIAAAVSRLCGCSLYIRGSPDTGT